MAPLRKKAETRLADARAALSDTSRQIGVIEAQRGKAILDEDDTAARKLDAELEELRRDARIGADRLSSSKNRPRRKPTRFCSDARRTSHASQRNWPTPIRSPTNCKPASNKRTSYIVG